MAHEFNTQYHKFENDYRSKARNALNIRDRLGYKTFNCDFQNPTIFPDVEVIPTKRVAETGCELAFFNTHFNRIIQEKVRTDEDRVLISKIHEIAARRDEGGYRPTCRKFE